MKRAAEVKKSETAKKMVDLRKSKQDLLDKQLAEQKKLIARIDVKGKEMKPAEKMAIMQLIKTLNLSISKTKDELEKLVHQSANKRSALEVRCHRVRSLLF